MFAGIAGNSGGSSVKSTLVLTAAASSPRRARILTFELGNATSPADNAFIFIVQQATTAGTGTTRTVTADDPADSIASTIVAKDTVTADPTVTAGAILMNWPVNQRASVRYASSPGAELVIPATASNGYMFGLSAASTTTTGMSAELLEL
jgi:hypothetical protein